MPETVKLIGGTKSKITKDENGENFTDLEYFEIALVHFNIVNNSCNMIQESGIHFS